MAPEPNPDLMAALLERLQRLGDEVYKIRLALWDVEYPPGHADRELLRPKRLQAR